MKNISLKKRKELFICESANTNTSVIGTVSAYGQVRNAVLGPLTRDDLFGENSQPIGQKIRINRIDFTVRRLCHHNQYPSARPKFYG